MASSESLQAPTPRYPPALQDSAPNGDGKLLAGVPPLPSPSPAPSMDDVLGSVTTDTEAEPGREDGKQRLFLCIDGGGTKTGVSIVERLITSNAPTNAVRLIARGSDRASNFSDRGLRAAVTSIGRATVRALEALPEIWPDTIRRWTYGGFEEDGKARRPAPFEGIWAGLSGVNHVSDVRIMRKALAELFGLEDNTNRIKVTNDCDLLASAIDIHHRTSPPSACEGGIVLIAGTGSIAMAFKPTESGDLASVGRAGGLGFLLGDEGSAYHIGRETLKAILDASDEGKLSADNATASSDVGRSTLIPLVLQHYGILTSDDLLGAVYALGGPKNVNEHDRKVRIAEVSRCAMACAYLSRTATLAECQSSGFGDPFALRVLEQSARCLSDLVRQLARRSGVSPQKGVLSLGGGTWGYEAFKATVLKIMKEEWGAEWKWVEVVRDADGTGARALALAAKDD